MGTHQTETEKPDYMVALDLAGEACEESIAAGKFFTICQSCCWPIEDGDKCYFSAAAEGYICIHCQKLYTA